MNEKYEVTGPIQRIEQRKPSVAGLEHLPNFDSFDLEFSPTGRVIRKTSYTGAGTVQSYERFLYDGGDKLIERCWFDGEGSQASSTHCRYDDAGKLVSCIGCDRSGAVTRTGTQRYIGELLVSAASTEANGSPVLEETFLYVDEKLAKSVASYYGMASALAEVWISYYNSSELVAETFGLTAEGKPLGDGRYRYEYDSYARKIKTWSYNDWADEDVPNSVFVFEYTVDEHGNWIERSDHHRSKNDPRWRTQVTKRKLTYFSPSEK
jgi:hypothetical protein